MKQGMMSTLKCGSSQIDEQLNQSISYGLNIFLQLLLMMC